MKNGIFRNRAVVVANSFLLSAILYLLSSILLLPTGCASAVAVGTNTALNGVDLVTMTDQMSSSILGDPAVQAAIAEKSSLKVVVEPVVNQMHAEILTAGESDAFTARLRSLLSHHALDKFTWIENRDSFYRLRNQELAGVDMGPSPDAVNPEYALTATFTSIANENDQSRNDYYVCNYSLSSLKDRSVLWTKSYEVQKRAVKAFLD
jgi:PBP1b-binding outer membrane lipoprotein LpoB